LILALIFGLCVIVVRRIARGNGLRKWIFKVIQRVPACLSKPCYHAADVCCHLVEGSITQGLKLPNLVCRRQKNPHCPVVLYFSQDNLATVPYYHQTLLLHFRVSSPIFVQFKKLPAMRLIVIERCFCVNKRK